MNFHRLLRSFRYGIAGLVAVAASEQNMRIHLLAAVAAAAAGWWFQIAAWEWGAVVLSMGLVLAAECMNTALERLADRVSRAEEALIGQAKDAAAAGVLSASLAAAIVGGIVFLPKVWAWFLLWREGAS